ncbi:MAG: HAMP domain-containing histidine kinase [Candidatus Obscuribacterales bacterium]|nr:HAMP domain-containing histidine kinase [Candidatus Obscuribacterales bacterium]
MKLRHQGLLLIGVPLACQFLFVGTLIVALLNLEKAAAKEAYAKQLLSKADDLRNSLGLSYLALSTMKISGSPEYLSTFQNARLELNRKLDGLRTLSKKDSRAAEIFADHINTMTHLVELLDQGIQDKQDPKYIHLSFARFLNEHELMEELTLNLHKLAAGSMEIHKRYAPLVNEFSPQAASQRAHLRTVIVAGLVLNAALALFLVITFSRTTTKRLDQLNSNMDKFAAGQVELSPVDGDDEIAVIDQKFRVVATARQESDEMRRSILNMVSHDMRSPLTSLHGTLEMTLQNAYGELEPKLIKTLTKCDSEIMRLIRLANDLLDAELIHEGKFEIQIEDNFIDNIVLQSINAVKGMADQRGITIKQDFEEGLEVRCDADRIVQVLVNLLSNALKYAPKESTVIVRASEQNAVVKVEVVDQGAGISEVDKARVFEKFEQLDQSHDTRKQGKGLGLSICKTLVEKHGGTIGVESAPGKGATFWFTLLR